MVLLRYAAFSFHVTFLLHVKVRLTSSSTGSLVIQAAYYFETIVFEKPQKFVSLTLLSNINGGMPRGRMSKISIPKSLKSIKTSDWKEFIHKVHKNAFFYDKWKIATIPPGSIRTSATLNSLTSTELSPVPKSEQVVNTSQSEIRSSVNVEQEKHLNDNKSRKSIVHQVWKSALPNLELMTKQQNDSNSKKTTSNYIDMANAVIKNAHALNSRLQKFTKQAETVGSVIQSYKSVNSANENLELNPISSKKSPSWISIGSGLYVLIMEQLTKFFQHSEKNDVHD